MSVTTAAPATAEAPQISPDLNHFLDLAHRGRLRGCSPGELLCCQIAEHLVNGPALDASAKCGLREFVQLYDGDRAACRRILEMAES